MIVNESKKAHKDEIYFGIYDSIYGPITIACSNTAVTFVQLGCHKPAGAIERKTDKTDKAATELVEFLSGERKNFDLLLEPTGTEFQREVWKALCLIPYGETRTYKDVAISIGKPKAYRAVGGASNKNPILIMIPCHRVIGANGSLVGYAGGIDRKEQLLKLEQKSAK